MTMERKTPKLVLLFLAGALASASVSSLILFLPLESSFPQYRDTAVISHQEEKAERHLSSRLVWLYGESPRMAMKSVLMNAPLEYNLDIHILADGKAYGSLEGIFEWTEDRTTNAESANVEPHLVP
jgi:hypothetical protein